MRQIDLTIVIPAYSEEKRIGSTLEKLASFLKHDDFLKHKEIEVIIVAADTLDNTQKIVASKQKLFRHTELLKPGPVVGKGRDVQFGMLRAHGKIIMFMDADLATPLYNIEKFYKKCSSGTDVVVGTRNLLTYRPSLTRRILSVIGNILFRVSGGIWIEDSQCGFKMFNRKTCQLCFSKMTILGWGFDMEILTIARENRLKIKSYRINDWKDMPNSTFNERTSRTILRSLIDMKHILINRFNKSYIEK
jgi:dolichyl-phosphate beta-glucosyltransferase